MLNFINKDGDNVMEINESGEVSILDEQLKKQVLESGLNKDKKEDKE